MAGDYGRACEMKILVFRTLLHYLTADIVVSRALPAYFGSING